MRHLLVTLGVSIFANLASAQTPAPAAAAFDFLCTELLQSPPAVIDYATRFDAKFRAAISEEKMKAVFGDVGTEAGPCLTIDVVHSGNQHLAILHGSKMKDVYIPFATDAGSNVITSLFVDSIVDESIKVDSWSDAVSALKSLDSTGKLSATLVTSDGSIRHTFNENDSFAIGSTFKLYVLGALDSAIANGRFKWTDELAIREDWKSLPSGKMHEIPAGQLFDLKSYAAAMVSISDNTATDHLINHLGRTEVEAMVSPMGNSHMQFPFLKTIELFKLKWGVDTKVADQYVLGDTAYRLAALTELEKIPRASIGSSYLPTYVSSIEWFATTPETCSAVFWLGDHGSQTTRDVLAINTPFAKPGGHWKYVGYKGGSEPGVISMTYLLESQTGHRACLSMSWNNETTPVSEYAFFSLVKKVLVFAEKQIP